MDPLASLAEWPVGTAACGVVARATATNAAGRGATAGTTPDSVSVVHAVGPLDHRFGWASVTKLATALAVLLASEEGTLALDDPAGPPGSTVRHLLAHASGLGAEPGPPVAPPATERVYSNAGYAELGAVLEARAGMPFGEYLRAGVLEPLGMDGTRLEGPGPMAPATGLAGPVRDLLALAGELLAPTLLSSETHRAMVTVQFGGLAGVLPGYRRFDPCDWGLGPELRGNKRPHWTGTANSPATFGHFGRAGGFCWVDPDAGLALAALSDRPFGPWAARSWPGLADDVLAWAGRRGADLLA